MPKVTLLDSVIVPAGEATRENREASAGETVDVPEAVAERLIANGKAEKAAGRSAKRSED